MTLHIRLRISRMALIKWVLKLSYIAEELKELQMMYHQETNIFRPADKLEELYFRGKEMHVANPEEYAVKNWIIPCSGICDQLRNLWV